MTEADRRGLSPPEELHYEGLAKPETPATMPLPRVAAERLPEHASRTPAVVATLSPDGAATRPPFTRR
jgi:hypothetical protein